MTKKITKTNLIISIIFAAMLVLFLTNFKQGSIKKEYNEFINSYNYYEKANKETQNEKIVKKVGDELVEFFDYTVNGIDETYQETKYISENSYKRKIYINTKDLVLGDIFIDLGVIKHEGNRYFNLKTDGDLEIAPNLEDTWIKYEEDTGIEIIDGVVSTYMNDNEIPSAATFLRQEYVKKEVNKDIMGDIWGSFNFDLTEYKDEVASFFQVNIDPSITQIKKVNMTLNKSDEGLSSMVIKLDLEREKIDGNKEIKKNNVVYKIRYELNQLKNFEINSLLSEVSGANTIKELLQETKLSEEDILQKLYLGSKESSVQLELYIQPLCTQKKCEDFVQDGYPFLLDLAKSNSIGLQILPANSFPPESYTIMNLIYCAAEHSKADELISELIILGEEQRKLMDDVIYYSYVFDLLSYLKKEKYNIIEVKLGINEGDLYSCMSLDTYSSYWEDKINSISNNASDIILTDQRGNIIENPSFEELKHFIDP